MTKGRLLSPIMPVVFIFLLTSCQSGHSDEKNNRRDSLAIRKAYSSSPVIPANESVNLMKVEPGFEVKLVATEPLVEAPVALTFDDQGRMWVVEMRGYMPNPDGEGEQQPNGKIVILVDQNKDGIVDERKVFMDSLVLPRAICLVENGILIAEPPGLWFVEINNDHPGKKILVDPKYAEAGNAEHQPNGLFRAMDNWIYNAEAQKRYRKKGNHWLIERSMIRGQWGISQDDNGRLFYNNNSQNLLGDYFPPGFGASNKNQRRVAGFSEKVVADNRVYPVRPTPGVNRGYMKGTLDDSLRLVNFTAGSGPVIYRGDLFGSEYYQNAFVGEPAANLIKRNILAEKGYLVEGKQAYQGKEFLSSTDERFRPVTLYNGPDGALYVLDMYRGVIQHKTYLTEYLKNEVTSRELYKPLNCGRIYKIVPQHKTAASVAIPRDPHQLVLLLQHPNGWVRDKAQQMLIDGRSSAVVPELRQALHNTNHPVTVMHSIWTLEGLDALEPADIIPLLQHSEWKLRMQALTVLPSIIHKNTVAQFLPLLEKLLQDNDTLAAPYIAFVAKSIEPFDRAAANRLLIDLTKKYPDNIYVSDAVISTLQNREGNFLKDVTRVIPDTTLAIHKQLNRVLTDIANSKKSKDITMLEKEYPRGVVLFRSICQTCHGADGNGIRALAPPLNNSNWVTGDKNKLLAIVLFGLTGPVTVSGKLYEAPEITGDMPGIANNKELTDEDISQLLSFIRNSWNNTAEKVDGIEVNAVRTKYKGRQKAFTMEELKK